MLIDHTLGLSRLRRWGVAFALLLVGLLGRSASAQAPTEAESLSASFRAASRKALPSVVGVRPFPSKVRGETTSNGGSPIALPGFSQGGSGVLIDSAKGYVLTNDHVVRGAARVVVSLNGGRREREVKQIRRDPNSDLALLVIEPKDLPPAIAWGDSVSLDLGDWVLAIGQPFGLTDTVTAGIVSGKGREIGIGLYEDLIQTDAAINPGNSGGPLINLKGEVVGISTAFKSVHGSFEGVGFAIPSSRAKRVAADLAEFGRVRRAYLGLDVRPVDPSTAERLDQRWAALVTSIAPKGPASDAGLRPGDILLKLQDVPLATPGALQTAIEVALVGKPLTLLVERNGKRLEIKVLPRSQPEDFGRSEP